MNRIGPGKIIAEVEHTNLVPFLKPQLTLNRIWGRVYWLFNAATILFIIYYLIASHASFDDSVKNLGLGFALFFILLPVHEGIHALAYKLMGAPQIGFGADWRKFIFYAVADQFVIGERKFMVVALSPFVLINVSLLLFMILFPPSTLLFLGALSLHTAGCFGDFALVSFMHHHSERRIVTMDSVAENKTFFFEGKDLN
jgi:hypothetical protein